MKTSEQISRSIVYTSAIVTLAVTGCGSLTRHGDAMLEDIGTAPSFLMQAADRLELPNTSLAKTGAFSYQVLNLPQEIYPSAFLLDVPQVEDDRWSHDQPWRHCIIRASLLTLGGKLIFSKKIDFSRDWNGSSQEGSSSDRRRIRINFAEYDFETATSSLPQHLSYVLRIEVIRPSLRLSNQLEIEAFALLLQKRIKNSIGTATMQADGSITLQLRAEGNDNGSSFIGDASITYKINDPNYAKVLGHVGPIKPGEIKLIEPWPDMPSNKPTLRS